MDIKMPIMNGLEATTIIKSLNKNLPIIIQTAYINEFKKNKSIKSGCDVYISKPIKKVIYSD